MRMITTTLHGPELPTSPGSKPGPTVAQAAELLKASTVFVSRYTAATAQLVEACDAMVAARNQFLAGQPKGAPPLSGAAGEAFALIDQLIKCSDKAKQTAKLLRSA